MSMAKKLGIAAAGLLFVSQAQAFSLTPYSLTTNSLPDAPASWFGVTLTLDTTTATHTATFSISNIIATDNSTKITDIYLGTDCGTTATGSIGSNGFCSIFDINSGALNYNGAMSYTIDTSPTGGSQIQNNAGWGVALLADTTTGSDASVINPGETLGLTFDLLSNSTTEQDLINAFFPPQDLGIAFHVQNICGSGSTCGGYSEWYSATPNQVPVPEPETLALLGMGLLGLVTVRRRRV